MWGFSAQHYQPLFVRLLSAFLRLPTTFPAYLAVILPSRDSRAMAELHILSLFLQAPPESTPVNLAHAKPLAGHARARHDLIST